MSLIDYGYSKRAEKLYDAEATKGQFIRARVIDDFGTGFLLASDAGELEAVLSGGLLSDAQAVRPVAGDWVLARVAPEGGHGQVVKVMPRYSELKRADTVVDWKSTVVAANFDYLMMMVSMNMNFSLNRIERLITSAWSSGGTPVLVLSKKDVCEDAESLIAKARDVVPGTDVVAISSMTGEGIEEVAAFFRGGVTCAVVGSSGVGKSTLLNYLMGRQIAKTASIRDVDSKGRHTTSHRTLHLLPGGGLFLDTPGVRSFGLTAEDEEMGKAFQDIEELAHGCRFSDCAHKGEPGCAVAKAIEDGLLEERRYLSYLKLQKEIRHVQAKTEVAARLEQKRKGKVIAKLIKQLGK